MIDVSSTPGSLYSQASAATQATPLVAGTQPQATPQVVVVNGTPLVAGTPMVRGTPRSPFPRGNPMNSPYLSQSSSRSQSTPISVSMRGDVGKRASRVVNLPRNVPTFPTASGVASNARNEPSTPV